MPTDDIRLVPVDKPADPDGERWHRVDGLENDLLVYVQVGFNESDVPVIKAVQIAGDAVHTGQLRTVPLGVIERQLRFGLSRTSSAYTQDASGEKALVVYQPEPGTLTRRRPDESERAHARRVALHYHWYAALSSKPAVEIAAANDLPVGTVRRWIREARQLGVLEPGTRGRAG